MCLYVYVFVHVHNYECVHVLAYRRFHCLSLLLHTEFKVSMFIRCTVRCEIWAQPAELVECSV